MATIARRAQGRTGAITGRIYLLLLPIPVVCFLGAVATDMAYSAGANIMWLNFSEWLLAAGLAFGALAAVALLVEFFASPAFRGRASGWVHLLLFLAVLAIELVNAFVHTKDGWTAVVPMGITLSVVGALAALAAVAALFFVPPGWTERRGVLS